MPFHEFLRQNLLFLFHIWFEAVHHLVPLTLPGRLHHGLLREPRRRLRAPAGTPNKNLKRQRWKNEVKTMRLNHFPLWNDLFYLLFSCLLLFYLLFTFMCSFSFSFELFKPFRVLRRFTEPLCSVSVDFCADPPAPPGYQRNASGRGRQHFSHWKRWWNLFFLLFQVF